MNTRPFPAAGTDVSLLGFGAMRLPVIDGDATKIDEAEAIRMIRRAIDLGVSYVDTAYVYHGQTSEAVVGKALKDGYREKTLVATKMPFWIMKGPEEMAPTLDEQLKRLDVDFIDLYLLHDIEGGRWQTVRDWKMYEFLANAKAEGKIRFAGFSFHGESPAMFKEVLDAYPWDFCQIQLNYMDTHIQAGLEGYEYAAAKGVPIIIMEPLKGGKLTDTLPESVQRFWDTLPQKRTPAEWALRWVANLPGVTTILSGMSTMAQVEENVRILSDADAGELTAEELDVIEKAAAEYRRLIAYSCTACKYCLPCTAGINIPLIMNLRNSWDLFDRNPKLKGEWKMFANPPASACIECGKCEPLCPQHLPIIQALKESAAIYE
ncbi:MAG: aldo/keto reductase [Clostridiales Family XIII bacterium]|jgi:predicted aldo/keto reductase-like oxidoreductase|nr:aldo/keto reductase [Clostridiales Family XIII bacterium]